MDSITPNATSVVANRSCVLSAPFTSKTFDVVLQVHCYFLGTVFNILMVTSILVLYRLVRLRVRHFMLWVCILLVIMSLLRYIYLSVDPYQVRGLFPLWVMHLMEDLAMPCITSAFAMVQYMLYLICTFKTRTNAKTRVLAAIVVFHFAFVIVIDLLIVTAVAGCWLLMFCQVVTLAWGLMLCFSMMMIAAKFVTDDRERQKTLRNDHQMSVRRHVQSGENGPATASRRDGEAGPADQEQRPRRDHLGKVKKICFSASVTGFLCFATTLVGGCILFNPLLTDIIKVSPNGWLGYQTCLRIIELAFGFILLYLLWQRRDDK